MVKIPNEPMTKGTAKILLLKFSIIIKASANMESIIKGNGTNFKFNPDYDNELLAPAPVMFELITTSHCLVKVLYAWVDEHALIHMLSPIKSNGLLHCLHSTPLHSKHPTTLHVLQVPLSANAMEKGHYNMHKSSTLSALAMHYVQNDSDAHYAQY
jgi:hypothetical protein